MIAGLNENHERSLLASLRYAAKLLRECEEVLDASAREDPFSKYVGALGPPRERIARDYLDRLHRQLAAALTTLGIAVPRADVPTVRALSTTITFVDNTVEEMRARYLRGYGEVSSDAEAALDGVVSTLQALLREADGFLTGGSAEALQARAAQVPPDHPFGGEIRELARLVTDHGLIDLRAALEALIDRALERTFEVAVVGRVSSGKSSLLNALAGADLLPTGILPVTAFPTRLRRGPRARLAVTDAAGRTTAVPLDRIAELVSEAANPGNEKRLTRLLVEHPSSSLPERVTFVDTPGLGSLATRGALHTFAYLPRCDHAIVVFDATTPIGEDDLGLLAFLVESDTAVSVVLSKADLLDPADLDRVQRYVATQCIARLGRAVPLQPISVRAARAALLTNWIAREIAPLGADAAARHRAADARRLAGLLTQALRMLGGARGSSNRIDDAADAALRECRARLELARRRVLVVSGDRAAMVEQALRAAVDVLARTPSPAEHGTAAARERLAAPVQETALALARDLETLATAIRDALAGAIDATGRATAPADDIGRAQRELPAFDPPPLAEPGHEPMWSALSASLRRRRLERWAAQHWRPPVERAVGAYLDVLKHWAREQIVALEGDVAGFAAAAAPLARGGDAPETDPSSRERDIHWLRDTLASLGVAPVPAAH